MTRLAFTANKHGAYTSGRYSIRPALVDGQVVWQAQHGRHFIGYYTGERGLVEAQTACRKYGADNAYAARTMLRSLRRRK